MFDRRLRPAPALLAIALAMPLFAEEPAPVRGDAPAPVPTATAEDAQIAAEALYSEAYAAYRKADFVRASELVDQALKTWPPHRKAQQLRQDVLGVLSHRGDTLAMAAAWFASLTDVAVQEKAVAMAALIASGDKKMAAGDYAGAELDYDRVDIGIRTFPYRFDWKDLPESVAAKKLEARQAARKARSDRDTADRQAAADRAREQAELQQQALKLKVDELLRRAGVAFARKDYRRAEVDAWNAYELDRRRDDARQLYLNARREGHVQFDIEYREQRLERISRVHEEIHKALIPQNELLVYPEDWHRRSSRKPLEIGSAKTEPWMATLNDRLEQRVTFDFQDQPFDDVVAFLRQITGINIVVSTKVTAAGAPPITLKVKDMRCADALKWILEIAGLQMAVQDQALFISNEPIVGAAVLRLYDVTDITSGVEDFPGKELAYNAGGGGAGGGGFSLFDAAGAGDEGGAPKIDAEALVTFIQENLGGADAWDAAKGFGIEKRGGNTLFVTQTPETHRLLEELLAQLRNQGALQVSVNVRMLDMSKNFFEEIGVGFFNSSGTQNGTGVVPSEILARPNPGSGAPGGIADPYGYSRVSDTYSHLGTVVNAMPSNAVNYSAINGNGSTNGLFLETSHNPFTWLNQDQVNMLLFATEDETDGTVLEHPALTCNNGQRAHAMFMQQVAYISDYNVVSSNYDPVIEVLNFGSILDIRPVVSSDRKYVTMEIRPSSVQLESIFTETLTAPRVISNGNGGVVYPPIFEYPLELPTVKVQTLRSTVMIPDRGSLLIGGFTDAIRQRTHAGVPFLSHIPFLGRLFSTNGIYDKNQRIFFLLNATILDLGEQEAKQ